MKVRKGKSWWRRASVTAAMLALAAGSWARAAESWPAGRITYVGTDDNIYYCGGGCAKPECVTCPTAGIQVSSGAIVPVKAAGQSRAQNNWPSYSPDGKKLAYISTGENEGGPSFAIYVYDFAKHEAIEVFESNRERPIYIFWLPDGESLSFLVTERIGLSLMLAKARERAPVRIVASGMPLFFDWNQPRHELVVHTVAEGPAATEQVSLMSLTDNNQQIKKVLSLGHSPFEAPAWSPDRAHLAYVTNSAESATLSLSDAEGKDPKAMVKLPPGDASFVWAPDSRHIAYGTSSNPGSMIFEGINLLDTTTGKVSKLVTEPLAAFYFSPDSAYLAYVAVPTGKAYYQWKVVELDSARTKTLVNFLTTRDEALAYRYFDQLALSHTIWSPDSKALVFAGVVVTGELPRFAGPSPPPYVFMAPIAEGKPHPIAEGTLGFWSPVAAN